MKRCCCILKRRCCILKRRCCTFLKRRCCTFLKRRCCTFLSVAAAPSVKVKRSLLKQDKARQRRQSRWGTDGILEILAVHRRKRQGSLQPSGRPRKSQPSSASTGLREGEKTDEHVRCCTTKLSPVRNSVDSYSAVGEEIGFKMSY